MPFGVVRPTANPPKSPTTSQPLSDDPILKELLRIYNTTNNTTGQYDDLFSNMAGLVRGAQGEAQSARTAYEGAVNAPLPQTPPLADLVARSLGQMASGLTGSQQPNETAENTIKNEQAMLTAQHAQELEALEKAYSRAADRAAKLGDTETEIKLRTKLEQALTARAEKLNMLKIFMQERMQTLREGAASDLAKSRDTEAFKRGMLMQGLWDPSWGPMPSLQRLPQGGGRYFGRVTGANRWPTLDQMADNFRSTVSASTKRNYLGQTGLDVNALRSAIINGEVPPAAEWQNDPQAYLDYISTLTVPGHPDILLFKRDKKTGKSVFDEALKRTVRRWFPDAK